MTQHQCKLCGRIYYRKHNCRKPLQPEMARCLLSGVPEVPVKAMTPWQRKAYAACSMCEHHVGGGCRLIPQVLPKHKPCDIGYFQKKGRGCFDDPPRFDDRPSHTFPKFEWAGEGGERCVCTIVVGDNAEELAQYTLPRIKAYADRCDAKLVVLRGDEYPAWPMANKFRIKPVAEKFERTLYCDIDVWLRDKIPNVFELFPPGKIYAHRDQNYLNHGHLDEDAVILGRPESVTECWNSGFKLLDRVHADIWTPPKSVEKFTHTLEQSTAEIHIKEKGYAVEPLPPEWNCQYWFRDKYGPAWLESNVVHLAGCPHETRVELLRQLAGTDWSGRQQRD